MILDLWGLDQDYHIPIIQPWTQIGELEGNEKYELPVKIRYASALDNAAKDFFVTGIQLRMKDL